MVLAPLLLGTTIEGKYRVERILGQGGMGVVVAARHLRLGQLVAIKFPLSASGIRQDAVERLLREARATMRIRSEHVARIHDVGVHESAGPYLVMEYLAGRDLGAVLAQDGPVTVSLAVEYVLQASLALAEAHAMGIVHRDLKPSNLFLSRRADGSPLVRVIDFGLAKALRVEDPVVLTKSGAMLGSPLFAAPEQMSGSAEVGPRSDVWALGATLYTLLTGAPPFPGRNLLEVYERIKLGPPKLVNAHTAAGVAVQDTLNRCLRMRPSERHSTVADFAEDLVVAVPCHALSYGRSVRRTLEGQGAAVDGTEVWESGSSLVPLAGDLSATQGSTLTPLGASWAEGLSRRQEQAIGTRASLSSPVDLGPARSPRLVAVVAAIAGIVGAVGVVATLGRGFGARIERSGAGSSARAIGGSSPAALALSSLTGPSTSAPQRLAPQESARVRPRGAPSALLTATSERQRHLPALLTARRAPPARDPLADPE